MVSISPIYKRKFRGKIYAADSLYLLQGKKAETWFVSPASREYFANRVTTFLSTY